MNNKYKLVDFLGNLTETLGVFPPNAVEIQGNPNKAQKREAELYKVCAPVYSIHSDALTHIRGIDVSLILGCNEVVVPVIIDEMAALFSTIQVIEEEYGQLKKYQEMASYSKVFSSAMKRKELFGLLIDDLKVMSEEFGFEFDIKESSILFKELSSTKKVSIKESLDRKKADAHV